MLREGGRLRSAVSLVELLGSSPPALSFTNDTLLTPLLALCSVKVRLLAEDDVPYNLGAGSSSGPGPICVQG